MGRINYTSRKTGDFAKELRKAMIDADLGFEDLGEGTASAWRKRMADPERMTVGQFIHLCNRCNANPDEIVRKSFKTNRR